MLSNVVNYGIGGMSKRLEAEILRLHDSDLHTKHTQPLAIAAELGVSVGVVRKILAAASERRRVQKQKLKRFEGHSNVLAIWESHNLGVPLSEFRRLFLISNSPKQSADLINWVIGLRLDDQEWCKREFGFADPWRRR